MFRNVHTNKVLSANQLRELHIREYTDMYNRNIELAEEFNSLDDFVNYMLDNDLDRDFVEVA